MPPTPTGTIALSTPLPVSVGDYVEFTTTIDGHIKNPRIQVLAHQNSLLVYGEAGGVNDRFELGGNPDGGSIWTTPADEGGSGGGAASCHADLYYFTKDAGQSVAVIVASCDFDAT